MRLCTIFTIPTYDSYIYSTGPSVVLSNGLLPMVTTVYDASEETFDLYSFTFPVDAGSIRIADVDYGLAGQYSQFVIACGTPGATVALQLSVTSGTSGVPGCQGVSIDLVPFANGVSGTVGSNGIVTLDVFVPSGFSGYTGLFQAYESATCRVSQLETHDFP